MLGRPGFYALEDYILKITDGYKIPHWKDTLHEYIDREVSDEKK